MQYGVNVMTHLTDEQKQEIFDMAVELIHEDAEHDQDYLNSIIKRYVGLYTVEGQLAMISSEEEYQTDLLGFDPRTGEGME